MTEQELRELLEWLISENREVLKSMGENVPYGLCEGMMGTVSYHKGKADAYEIILHSLDE